MAAYLITGFDLERTGAMGVEVDNATNNGIVTMSAGTYAHRDLSDVKGAGEYTTLADALEVELDAILTTFGFDEVAWSESTGLYTLTYDASFTCELDFRSATLGNDNGKRLAEALGFSYLHADASGGSASDPYDILLSGQAAYTSNVAPAYYLGLAVDGVADYVRPFEVPGQTVRKSSVNGSAYSVGPHTYEKRVEGKLRFNTLASVHASEADDSVAPWTYEDLLEHARSWEPVLLHYSGETTDMVFEMLEPEFSKEARVPVWPNYHGKWDLQLKGQFLGRV